MEKDTKVHFKQGDIILNGWASNDNPTRYFIYRQRKKRLLYGIGINIQSKKLDHKYAVYLPDSRDDTTEEKCFKKVGHIDLFDLIEKEIDYTVIAEPWESEDESKSNKK